MVQLIEMAVQHFGRIDVLINNAGQAVAGTVADLDLEAYRQVIELEHVRPDLCYSGQRAEDEG